MGAEHHLNPKTFMWLHPQRCKRGKEDGEEGTELCHGLPSTALLGGANVSMLPHPWQGGKKDKGGKKKQHTHTQS